MIKGKGYTDEEFTLKRRALDSLYIFTKYILGYKDLVERVHKPLCDFIQGAGANGGTVLDLEPRDTFKTTCCTIGYSVWMIVKDRDIRIDLNVKALGKGKEKLNEIKGHFEKNRLLQKMFGFFVGDVWKQDQITVTGRSFEYSEPTLSLGAVGHELTSGHYDLIINDDLAGLKDMFSEAERANVIRFYKSLKFVRDKGKFIKEVNIGTRWHLFDISDYIIKNRLDAVVRIKKALLDNGESYFPERYSTEELRKEEKEDPVFFSSQRQNLPLPEATQVYTYEELKFYEGDINGGINYGYIDLAMAKTSKSDYVSFIIGNKGKDKIRIPYCNVARTKQDDLIQLIKLNVKEYGLRKLGIESNSFQELYVDNIKKALKAEKIYVDIMPIVSVSDKYLRIASVHGQVVTDVLFREDWEQKYPLLIRQLISFPQGHDDAPDSLSGLLMMFGSISEPKIRWL